ncbi:MAG: hypothetical protein IPO21_09985 [Bacteroidales bacterium]|nr:hypothetical protein [Bacteroidales bacterium]
MRKIYLFLILSAAAFVLNAQQLLNHKGKDVFFSGINIAWISFATDLNSLNEAEFTRSMREISEAGGNAARWWLHTNGVSSPTFNTDSVTGITERELKNLKLGLDIAAEHGGCSEPVFVVVRYDA